MRIYQRRDTRCAQREAGPAQPETSSTLEDNVTVYSGASILGGDTVIGGAVIGSNAFITSSLYQAVRGQHQKPELQFKDRKKAQVQMTEQTGRLLDKG